MKIVLRRPLFHHVIIIGYVLAPFVNIALLVVFTHLPLAQIMRRLFAGYGVLASAWLLTAPVVGLCLYSVKRWSWYLFLGHSSLILLDFLLKWIIRPHFYITTIPKLNNLLILLGNLGLVGAIGYMIQRDFRAPYFQALKRHWRESERIPMRHEVVFGGIARQIDDISTTGCFVRGVPEGCTAGQALPISFHFGTQEFSCHGQVMRITPAGCGVRFSSLGGKSVRALRTVLRHRFALRYQTDLEAAWVIAGSSKPCRVLNISAGGAYLGSVAAPATEGGHGMLRITHAGLGGGFPAHVAWVNPEGAHGKAPGFGVQFSRRQTRFARRVFDAGYRTLIR